MEHMHPLYIKEAEILPLSGYYGSLTYSFYLDVKFYTAFNNNLAPSMPYYANVQVSYPAYQRDIKMNELSNYVSYPKWR